MTRVQPQDAPCESRAQSLSLSRLAKSAAGRFSPAGQRPARARIPGTLILGLVLILLAASGCAPSPKRVILEVDGVRRVVETEAVTVQDVLKELKITLGDNDRVDPPAFAEVDRSATIVITRVAVKTEMVRQTIPFARRLVRDESYPLGQVRVLQLGANGMTEITYTVTVENGKETSRRETGRRIVTQPKNEVLAAGTQGSLLPTPLTGSVLYRANGNAWVMRNSSGDKRPLTNTGDLDGRVWSISADGRYLLFSRAGQAADVLNTLWIIDTLVVGETPRALPFQNVMFAQLAPDARSLAYSTGERTPGAPGWKAHNDFWIAPLHLGDPASKQPAAALSEAKSIWKPSQPAPYSWWGANFAWAPDGSALAYAFPNEIGFAQIPARLALVPETGALRRPWKRFAPFETRGDWVWVPQIAWSSDSRFAAAVIHAPLASANVANDDPTFELWVYSRDGSVSAPLARQTGMWGAPLWSPVNARGESRIAFGVALSPSDSERSRYALYVMDRDGGNKTQIFPQAREEGLDVLQVAWSPDGSQLIAVREDDLWLYALATGRWTQLTANGASSLPRWGR